MQGGPKMTKKKRVSMHALIRALVGISGAFATFLCVYTVILKIVISCYSILNEPKPPPPYPKKFRLK